jgi:hypothetical protein
VVSAQRCAVRQRGCTADRLRPGAPRTAIGTSHTPAAGCASQPPPAAGPSLRQPARPRRSAQFRQQAGVVSNTRPARQRARLTCIPDPTPSPPPRHWPCVTAPARAAHARAACRLSLLPH